MIRSPRTIPYLYLHPSYFINLYTKHWNFVPKLIFLHGANSINVSFYNLFCFVRFKTVLAFKNLLERTLKSDYRKSILLSIRKNLKKSRAASTHM
jgi:hypothetical protein